MIPPHELKNKEFTRVMRGYSIPEVDEYISFVMEKYTDLYRENDALERKLQSAMDALDAMRAEEESIRTALINAQKAGKQIVADASDRADKIMRSTKSDCMRVLAEFRDMLRPIRRAVSSPKAKQTDSLKANAVRVANRGTVPSPMGERESPHVKPKREEKALYRSFYDRKERQYLRRDGRHGYERRRHHQARRSYLFRACLFTRRKSAFQGA